MKNKKMCPNCGIKIDNDMKSCPNCLASISNDRKGRIGARIENTFVKQHALTYGMVGALIVLIIPLLIIFVIPFPYQATETCYTHELVPQTEYYRATETGKGCDADSACTCLHESWWGLGACDSCSCLRSRIISVPKDVQYTKTIWKSDTLIHRWTGKTQYWFETNKMC